MNVKISNINPMKKLLFFLLLCPFMLMSCSDDDDNLDDKTNPIVGTWEFTKIEAKEVNVSTPELITAITADIKKGNDNPSHTMTFTKDGKVSYVMGKEGNMHGTYTVKDNVLTYTIGNNGSTLTCDIAFSDKTMTMLTDMTNYYKNKDVLKKILNEDAAETAVVNKVNTLETYTRK